TLQNRRERVGEGALAHGDLLLPEKARPDLLARDQRASVLSGSRLRRRTRRTGRHRACVRRDEPPRQPLGEPTFSHRSRPPTFAIDRREAARATPTRGVKSTFVATPRATVCPTARRAGMSESASKPKDSTVVTHATRMPTKAAETAARSG